MVHRLALTIGGLGAVSVMALAFVVSGGPAGAADALGAAAAAVEPLPDEVAVSSEQGTRGSRTVVDTVYVRPPADNAPSRNNRPDATAAPSTGPASTDAPPAQAATAPNRERTTDSSDDRSH